MRSLFQLVKNGYLAPAHLLSRMGVTPNQLTLFRLLVPTPIVAWMLMSGMYVEGWLLMSCTYVCDSWDGALARLNAQKDPGMTLPPTPRGVQWSFRNYLFYPGPSEWGAEFDALADKVSFVAWGLALATVGEFSAVMETIFLLFFIANAFYGVLLTLVRRQKRKMSVTTRSNSFGKVKVWVEWAAFSFACFTQFLPAPLVWQILSCLCLFGAWILSALSYLGHRQDIMRAEQK